MTHHTPSKRAEKEDTTLSRFLGVCSLMLLLLVSARLCDAQITTTGTINGTVVDQTGAVIPGSNVAITEIETGTQLLPGWFELRAL
jgi:hypothetical protein